MVVSAGVLFLAWRSRVRLKSLVYSYTSKSSGNTAKMMMPSPPAVTTNSLPGVTKNSLASGVMQLTALPLTVPEPVHTRQPKGTHMAALPRRLSRQVAPGVTWYDSP